MSKYLGVRLKDEDEFYLQVVKDYLNRYYPFKFNDSDAIRYCLKSAAENIEDLKGDY